MKPLLLLRVESTRFTGPGDPAPSERVHHQEIGATDEATLLRALAKIRWTPRMSVVPGNEATLAFLLELGARFLLRRPA